MTGRKKRTALEKIYVGSLTGLKIMDFKKNWYKDFSAYVLAENRAMLHVFHKHYPDAQKQLENGHVQLYMDFRNSKTGYDSADRDQIQTP